MPAPMNNVAQRAFSLLESILSELKIQSYALKRLTDLYEDQAHNAYAEGAIGGGPISIGATGITQTGWNSPYVLDANPGRGGLTIINTGTNPVTLGLGNTSPSFGSGIVLAAGASWDGRLSHKLWRGSVSARTAAGTTTTLAYVEIA